MDKIQIPCVADNFLTGRPAGSRPEAIVLHRSGGSAEEIRARFLDRTTATSAHYVVCKNGSVLQFVPEQDTAFHAGLVINPTWKGLKPNTNPNFYTIGIELEGSPDETVGDEQSDACAALVAEIAARCAIAIDEGHVVLHSEIRASRNCPGPGFARAGFLQAALLAAISNRVFPAAAEIDILKDTNVREGLPSTSARVVSVLRAGSKARVAGFTLHGEALHGNSAWHQTEDGNFFWAGNSSIPAPRPISDDREDTTGVEPENAAAAAALSASGESEAGAVAAPPVVGRLGIADIDRFFTGAPTDPLDLSKGSREAIETLQDLLTCHGFSRLPSVLSPAYGTCGDATRKALSDFQNACGLPIGLALSSATMQQLVGVQAKDPRATRAYFSLVLGVPFSGMDRVLALTAQMEGVGKFAALNLNTDSAGLSFGLIQWAQRPGRLVEIVLAFRKADPAAFARIFGEGDATLAGRLIAHLKRPSGGVDDKTGVALDPQFDLVADPWVKRFREAALTPPYQKAQVNTAREAFNNSLGRLRKYDTAGLVKSERAVAFMLDVANQFGDGSVQRPAKTSDRGLAGLYRRVFRLGMAEQDLLKAIADATVAAMSARFQAGVRARRDLFLTTSQLSSTNEFSAT
jgi:hypothetical protein